MHIHEWHSVCICIMTRCTKNIGVPNCHSNRKSAIFIQSSHFTPIFIHFHASYFNKLLLQIEQHRLPIYSVSSTNLEDKNVSKAFIYKHGGCHGAIHLMLRHKASSPYNVNIQFPMYTKFITHVYDVALNTSMHQYNVISIGTQELRQTILFR